MKGPVASPLPPDSTKTKIEPSDVETLHWEEQAVQLAIARRAYELFEIRGREHGHDREDWFQAESELLCPVPFITSETETRLSVRANISGFDETEIKTGVEPHRLTILGQKRTATMAPGAPSPDYLRPEWILRTIDLPFEIDPAGTIIELKAGVLSFELPKVVEQPAIPQAQAA